MLENNTDSFCKVLGVWNKALNVLNCVIALDSTSSSTKVTVLQESIIVTQHGRRAKFNLPNISVLPYSCRGLKLHEHSGEIEFSFEGSQHNLRSQENEMTQKKYSRQTEMVDRISHLQNRWFCATCQQKILSDLCHFNRVLPLPSENWSDLADIWFCHNHSKVTASSEKTGDVNTNTCNSTNGVVPGKMKQKLLPGNKECFVGETYVLVARRYVAKGSVKVTAAGEVTCFRCKRQLGVAMDTDKDEYSQVIKFFLHTFFIKDFSRESLTNTASIGHRVDLDGYFSNLILEQSQSYSSFRFLMESEPDTQGKSTCLLWLLDSCVRMYTSAIQVKGEEGILEERNVVKFMFKCQLATSNSDRPVDYVTKSIVSMWRRDDTVHGVTLPHQVFLQLVQLLVHNCKVLPQSQRFLNGFHVSFLKLESPT
ncbi:E3 ubiquitin-protein ligase E3D-like [Mya arenaria]|uniref:E3 ubiquitin-protein ligase E3D-like n=1 Tax=Mya arenaria TaxID=6604 RepID=UPI0022E1F37B|nr:E3 ubiquitin-protein ligase E3D-like [Mya arenaria]